MSGPGKAVALHRCPAVASLGAFMDKFWSIFCVPIGVFLCFGPALIAWVWAERREARHVKATRRPDRSNPR